MGNYPQKKVIIQIKNHCATVIFVRYPNEIFEHWTRREYHPTHASIRRVDNLFRKLGLDYFAHSGNAIFIMSNLIGKDCNG